MESEEQIHPRIKEGTDTPVNNHRLRRGMYILPSLFTVGTLICGYFAILSTLRGTQLMAAGAAGITPIARPSINTPEAIMQVMDRGALGVQVPHVNTPAEARRAGNRAPYARRSDWGVLSLVSFFARAKKETRPRCGEPQLAVEIARAARDTIQDLDSRFRGNDGIRTRANISTPPSPIPPKLSNPPPLDTRP